MGSTSAQPGLPQQVQQPARLDESKPADAQHGTAVERFSNPRAETEGEERHACATADVVSGEVGQACGILQACHTLVEQ